MGDLRKKTLIPLVPEEFKETVAGKLDNEEGTYALINEENAPLEEMIHPLTYSLDTKKHPDMHAIPAATKFTRDFQKLYEELRK